MTISNTGTGDATAVQFNDSVDTNTTLVGGSVTTQPVTAPDSFNVIGNVRIQVPDGASDLLAYRTVFRTVELNKSSGEAGGVLK